ncbi:MAG: hypothetical protein ACLP9S_06395 [Syntrophales bacterium]
MGLFDFIFGRELHCRLGIHSCYECPHNTFFIDFWKEEKIKREKGYLYYIGRDGYIWASPMKHNKTGVKKRVSTKKLEKKRCKYLV